MIRDRVVAALVSLCVVCQVLHAGSPQSMGLVLSGGGAKGIAHIGVIQALEENGIPIDYVAGTSMGAIVGGLYAAGYTPAEMMQLITSREFSYWSTGQIDEKLTYYFAKPEPTPSMIGFNVGERDSTKAGSILPSSVISPLPMNFAFMELFAAYTAQCGGDFNNLFVPFRCVASDVYDKRKIVCRNGSLGDAIRASMSFPIVFHPIKMNGTLVYDGGIYDNYPVDVMQEDFAPSFMIGVDVSSPDGKPKANDVIDQLEDMIMQKQDSRIPDDAGINIHVNLEEFGLLDFPKAEAIYRIGYEKAMSMMDSIKSRVYTRVPAQARELRRMVFKSKTPYVVFDSVSVTGGTDAQNDYIAYLFTKGDSDTFGLKQAKDAYYRAITPGKLRNLVPQARYDETDGLFSLDMEASVKDNYRLGIGGYITSSANSMMFLSGGYNTLSFNALDANAGVWVGQSYMAADVNAKVYLRTSLPSYLMFRGVLSRQKFYESDNLFYEENMPTFISNTEAFARMKYCVAAGRSGKVELGGGYGWLLDRFYRSNNIDFSANGRDECTYNLGELAGHYEYNTLDSDMYPSSGCFYGVTAMGVYGRYRYNPAEGDFPEAEDNIGWGQIEVTAENYSGIGRHFVLGTAVDLMASTKKLLDNYNATIVSAPAFNPTPSSYNAFNQAFRANSFIAAGLLPIWKFNETLQLRGTFHAFLPFRKIKENPVDFTPYYGRWFSDPEFFGEAAFVVGLPFASLSVYGNYMSYPARNWNFGISFGLFFLAPKFLR